MSGAVSEKDHTETALVGVQEKCDTQEMPVSLENPLHTTTPKDEVGDQTVLSPPQQSHQMESRPSSMSNTQVIALERACCASSVTVTHTDQITEHSAAEQAELNSSPFFLVYNRKSGRKVTRWRFFANWDHHHTARIVVVWSPNVITTVYKSSAQAVTFLGDFNQIIRTSQHSNSMHIEVDTSGVDDMNLAMQEADLFEAQGKGLSFTWWNNQELTHISKKIDHALINQSWATKFPEGYAEFLEPHQSDHAPCLFHLPSARRRVPKPFKFYNHILDHPQFEETVRSA
ncbi:BnaC03g48920D [Brassica napus]|uniref:BnaC03g48920D protein n=1 Tax=Brassica napus TaxID=3708 RepID=A0A078FNY2_BRANA|nr:BnaC03g48920D [Brassica napus]